MNGVEIINTAVNSIVEVQNQKQAVSWVGLITVICTVAAVAFYLVLVNETDFSHRTAKHVVGAILTGFSPIIGLAIGAVISCNFIESRVIVGEEHIYEMCVSDEVSLNDFTENYEIISSDGNVYTVREVIMYDEPIPEKGVK